MLLFNWLRGMIRGEAADFKFAAADVSACGLVRSENQDHLLSIPDAGFFCIADGMGGGKGGALASQWVCESLSMSAGSSEFPTLDGDGRMRLACYALQQANDRIRAYAREKGYRSMGATAAVMAFAPQDWSHPRIAHAGDSRVYRLRRGELQLLTNDHTVGGEMSRKTISRTEADNLKSRSNPLSHILTRAVGTEFRVRPECQTVEARPGDRFLLCTDGVHDMLSDGEIADAMRGRKNPGKIVRDLEQGIIAAGAGDNYSMICVEIRL